MVTALDLDHGDLDSNFCSAKKLTEGQDCESAIFSQCNQTHRGVVVKMAGETHVRCPEFLEEKLREICNSLIRCS